jgi:hypothetical protein
VRNSSKTFVLSLLLGGCAMQSSLTGGGTSPSGTSGTSASSTSANGGPRQYADQDEHAPPIRGAIVRSQLDPVRGMTVDDAKAYLLRLGHDGEVAIRQQHTFSDRCGINKVCDVQPESGTGVHDRIELVINPGANTDITLPD